MLTLKLLMAKFLVAMGITTCIPIVPPIVIRDAGRYCLARDATIEHEGINAIEVTTPNVTVDLAGHTLTGPGTGTGSGIVAHNVGNVTVTSGTITKFFYGILLENSPKSSVRHTDLSENTFRGVYLRGAGGIIENVQVRDIFGYPKWPNSHSMGIEVAGPNCIVRHSQVRNIMPFGPGEGVAISVDDNPDNCRVYGNDIRFAEKPAAGRTLGIWGGSNNDVGIGSVQDNVIIGADYGLFRWHATDHASKNYIRQRCDAFWLNNLRQTNDYKTSGGCTDAEAAEASAGVR